MQINLARTQAGRLITALKWRRYPGLSTVNRYLSVARNTGPTSIPLNIKHGDSQKEKIDAKQEIERKPKPTINFDTMTAKELTLFLKAAEVSKVSLTRYLGNIADVIAREPRFDSADGLSAAAYAMRDCDDKSENAQRLLTVLSKRLNHARRELNVIEICKCMAGLRNMNSEQATVRKVIESMGLIISNSRVPMQSRSFGTILYALKRMNSDSSEIRRFLAIFTEKLEEYDFPLDGQCIGNMLLGMQGMDSQV